MCLGSPFEWCSRHPSDWGQLHPLYIPQARALPGEGNTVWEIAPWMVITGPCWDSFLLLGQDRSGHGCGAAAWGTLAALDGSVTQAQAGFLSSRFGNKDKACLACDWERVFFRGGTCKFYCDILMALLTRFTCFFHPVSSFYLATFPCFRSFQLSFYFPQCILASFPCLFWADWALERSQS